VKYSAVSGVAIALAHVAALQDDYEGVVCKIQREAHRYVGIERALATERDPDDLS
jgi:hypothetical protein